MGSKLTTSLSSDSIYNAGGVTSIWLLHIENFVSYKFADDGLYNTGYVSEIKRDGSFIKLGHENESQLTETFLDGIYRQELKSFIRVVDRKSINWLMQAQGNRFVVIVKSRQGPTLIFGSDGGAKLSYTGQSGQTGDVNGISIKLEKTSLYPLFEIDPETLKNKVLSTEAIQYICTENNANLIEIV